MDYNKIYIAQVEDNGNRDSSHFGRLKVRILNNSTFTKTITANCIMSFGGNNSGIFGNVTPGQRVLVTQVCVSEGVGLKHPSMGGTKIPAEDVYEWFWIGVVPEPHIVEDRSLDPPENRLTSSIPDAEDMYHTTNIPNRTVIKNTVGHKLVLADKTIRSNNSVTQEDYAQLVTNTNKQIKLDAGTGKDHDRIVIADEHGNKIIINSTPENKPGPNSILMECIGNIHALTHKGEIDITAGKESKSNISVTNRGSGNIHIQSSYGDVTVKAEKEINLQCENVKVTAKDSITVDAVNDVTVNATDVTVNATNDATVIADNNLTLEGGVNVDITAGAIMTLKAMRINMDSV